MHRHSQTDKHNFLPAVSIEFVAENARVASNVLRRKLRRMDINPVAENFLFPLGTLF